MATPKVEVWVLPVAGLNGDTGSNLLFCSDDCVVEWAEEFDLDGKITLKGVRMSPAADVCTHCAGCGFSIFDTDACWFHPKGCPEWDWKMRVGYMSLFAEELGSFDMTDRSWRLAEKWMAEDPGHEPDDLAWALRDESESEE